MPTIHDDPCDADVNPACPDGLGNKDDDDAHLTLTATVPEILASLAANQQVTRPALL